MKSKLMLSTFKYSLPLLTLLTTNLAAASVPMTYIHLNKVDPRTITEMTVFVLYNIQHEAHWDLETIGTWNKSPELSLRKTSVTRNGDGVWVGDLLTTTNAGSSCTGTNCRVNITKDDQRAITDLSVEVAFKVNGEPHYDFERVTIPVMDPPWGIQTNDFILELNVDGRGANWNGSYWEGNLISTPPQINNFYWNLPNHEIWISGFAPNSNAKMFYDNASFGPELLYFIPTDANGTGHYTQTNVCANLTPQLKMRASDISSNQHIRVVDVNGGPFKNTDVSSIRACGYFP